MNTCLFAATPGVYYAFQNSDGVGKAIVVLLIIGSMLAWTIMLEKWLHLYQAGKWSKHFSTLFNDCDLHLASPSLRREANNSSGPLAAIYAAGARQLNEFYQMANPGIPSRVNGAQPCKLSEAQLTAIEAVMETEVSNQIKTLEKRVGTVATLVSLSPFCGLFGTVWGVMMAFAGIAIAGKPDFTALAPGVAGALLTTVAGLIVAIPSLVGYNCMTGSIRSLSIDMDNFTGEFMARLKLEQASLENDTEY